VRVVALLLAALLVTGATSVGSDASAGARAGSSLTGQRLEVLGAWSGAEQKSFRAVLDRFEQKTGAKVAYTSAGDDLAPTLTARVAGGNPPDVAMVPQPGLLAELVEQGALVPIDDAAGAKVDANYASIWRTLGSIDGTLYGVWFKAADKSLWWYDAPVFDNAGVTPPATMRELLNAARKIAAAGVTPFSVGGADGWTLTDQFENIYLATAGPAKYDQLAQHEIAWTDASVTAALRAMGELLQPQLVAGGLEGALRTDFPTSVRQVFAKPPDAAMVMEGDFVAGVITSETNAEVGHRARVFPYPAATSRSAKPLIVGGDAAVLMRDSEAGRALIEFLATPDAAAAWARRGGFISPNRNVEPRRYPDAVTRSIARQMISARDGLRFDLSDLQPAAFGATEGSGLWQAFQDFLANPADAAGAAAAMEAAAALVYAPAP
jgi:ABC-type glycerol-3-phosphate transport system substrate-binding protein